MKYLIVGLGNIGAEYADTRHNIGFDVLDALAEASNTSFTTDRYGAVATLRSKGHTLVLLKPSTYMNLSGKAVRYWLDAEKIPRENLLVVVDDIALPFGTFRMRTKGSAGGHNGLKNITELLGTEEYSRIRFGIGGMSFLYLLQPLFQKLTTRMSKRALAAVSGALTLLLLADTVYTFILRG